jgi:hypothetical protein
MRDRQKHYGCRVRPRGRWIYVTSHRNGQRVFRCSACGRLRTTRAKRSQK